MCVLVDSGSTCNVVDRETREALKRKKIKCKSWKLNRKLYSTGSEEALSAAGKFEVALRYKDRQCTKRFVVAEEKETPILGQETSQLLAVLKIDLNSVNAENLLREFERFGKLEDFQAKLHVDKSVTPIAQKLKPLPYG